MVKKVLLVSLFIASVGALLWHSWLYKPSCCWTFRCYDHINRNFHSDSGDISHQVEIPPREKIAYLNNILKEYGLENADIEFAKWEAQVIRLRIYDKDKAKAKNTLEKVKALLIERNDADFNLVKETYKARAKFGYNGDKRSEIEFAKICERIDKDLESKRIYIETVKDE